MVYFFPTFLFLIHKKTIDSNNVCQAPRRTEEPKNTIKFVDYTTCNIFEKTNLVKYSVCDTFMLLLLQFFVLFGDGQR